MQRQKRLPREVVLSDTCRHEAQSPASSAPFWEKGVGGYSVACVGPCPQSTIRDHGNLESFSGEIGARAALRREDLARVCGCASRRFLFFEHRAFRWDAGRGPGRLIAIERPADFDLGDLMGVEESIARLTANTEQFLGGLPFNHVLLYGERGTGKSSAVKGLCGRYAERGLRLVEVNREDLIHLPAVLEALREGEEFRFLIFCDDLSFGSDEVGFRELKAALEGRLEAPPKTSA